MRGSYTPAIDWLKCLGITLIVYGHVAAWAPLAKLPPIYSKQLGVAFFLFASGYSLTAETRKPWRVAFNRLFEIYLFGVPLAVLISMVSFGAGGRGQLSNFLPFLGGANVVFNNFPANPTTWYLGTYLQLMLAWTLLSHRIRASAGILAVSLLVEVALRALLMQNAGAYVAYMLLPNWSTVFLLGCWCEQQHERQLKEPGGPSASASPAWALVVLFASLAGWSTLTGFVPFTLEFPFMRLGVGGATASALLVSMMVSTVYAGATWLVYRAAAPWPAPRPVRFVARNTLIVFLAHMPLYYLMLPVVENWPLNSLGKSTIYMIACLPVLAWLSEGIRRAVRPRELREHVAVRVFGYAGREPLTAATQEATR